MQAEAPLGWQTEVERGPGWLFVRLRLEAKSGSSEEPVSDAVWRIMQSHLTRRVVMEMDDVPLIASELLGQLLQLNRMIQAQGGLMRLSGVSVGNREVLRRTRLDERFPQYSTREDAVMAGQRAKPR